MSRKLNEKETVMREQFEEKVLKGISKSDLFREMYDGGLTVGDISKITECHYSFVYGVISSSRELEKKEGESKSSVIRRMVDEGKNPGQISKELNSNYSFVFSVVKKYKMEKEKEA
jgi:transposase-like protein